MKRIGVLIASVLVVGSVSADILWEDNAPVGGNMNLITTTETAVTGGDTGHGDIGEFTSNQGGQWMNYNIGGQDWSAYAGEDWTFTVDIYITAAQAAEANIMDDTIYYNLNGTQAGFTILSGAGWTADAWNTVTWTGTFDADPGTLGSSGFLFLNNDKGTHPGSGPNYYIDNFKLEAVPEPGTLGLIGAAGLALIGLRRLRMM